MNKLKIFNIFDLIYILFLLAISIFFKDGVIYPNLFDEMCYIYIFIIRYIIGVYYIFNTKKIFYFNIIFKIITDFIIYIFLIVLQRAYIYGLVLSFFIVILEVFYNILIIIPLSLIAIFKYRNLKNIKITIILLLIIFFIFDICIIFSGFNILSNAILLP